MLKVTSSGSFGNTQRFLNKIMHGDPYSGLESYAQRGVDALRAATAIDSAATSESWYYEIEREGENFIIWWLNSNEVNGFHVAIGLQYGHATGTGGWVEGYDYINPALRPIFDEIAEKVWKEVQRA